MNASPQFGDVLDAADELPLDQQEELVAILQRRIALSARQRLIEDVRQSAAEFKAGLGVRASVEEIMREASR